MEEEEDGVSTSGSDEHDEEEGGSSDCSDALDDGPTGTLVGADDVDAGAERPPPSKRRKGATTVEAGPPAAVGKYVPPAARLAAAGAATSTDGKYVPPAARSFAPAAGGSAARALLESSVSDATMRRMRGLLNKLTEQTIAGVSVELATLFAGGRSRELCAAFTKALLGGCLSETQILAPLILLDAALVRALSIRVGQDVLTALVEQLVLAFESAHAAAVALRPSTRARARALGRILVLSPSYLRAITPLRHEPRHVPHSLARPILTLTPTLIQIAHGVSDGGHEYTCCNAALLLAHLYNLGAVHATLLYELIRRLVHGFREAELQVLITILRVVGPQLRSDDPSALRDIILDVQARVASSAPPTAALRDGRRRGRVAAAPTDGPPAASGQRHGRESSSRCSRI